jgi:hypothetical protein
VPKENRPQLLERAAGDSYAEMIGFVTRMDLSYGLRSLLDGVCKRERCQHVPSIEAA